jgi:hypothetical protein
MPNERYVYDIIYETIVDYQSDQPHDLEKLESIALQLIASGKSSAELIEIFMKSFGLTVSEATALLQKLKGYDSSAEPDPEENTPGFP